MRPRKKVNVAKVGEEIASKEQKRKEMFKELVHLTMKQENVPYQEALSLIRKSKVATLIAIEFSQLV